MKGGVESPDDVYSSISSSQMTPIDYKGYETREEKLALQRSKKGKKVTNNPTRQK